MLSVVFDLQLIGVLEVVVQEVDEVLEIMLPLPYIFNLDVVILQVLNLLVEHHKVEHDKFIFHLRLLVDEDAIFLDLVGAPS